MFLSIVLTVILCFCVSSIQSDPCASRPCQNTGICTSSNGVTFVCKCPRRFFGDRCEKENDACEAHACKNGAVCRADVHGDYHCVCPAGYRGKFCDIDHDDCLPSPCQNSALCKDKIDDYECTCREAGTFGKHCELREDDLARCVKECPDGSICWRNYTTTLTIPWGYGDNICNTQHSCFGKQNKSHLEHFDFFIDVQLRPVQMQLGDILNFTSDNSISAAVDGLMPMLIPVDVYNDSLSFVNCNTTNGTQLVTTPQHHIIVNNTALLHVGVHYFIMNIDFTYRCDFGLRLNISVKEHDCQNPEIVEEEMCSNRGQCHTNFDLAQYQCKCCGGFRGKYCEKRDYCFSQPCKNQAECWNIDNGVGDDKYECRCQPGYEGKHCSIEKDMCLSHPCRNGALCQPMVNSYNCQCKAGFTGQQCQVNVDECSTLQPCENNATCVDGIADFSCVCPSGFTGSHCEVNINECASYPCKRGVCIDKINSFHCSCPAGYTGSDCDSRVNESCSSQPCLHGGVCVDKGTDHECHCGLGYEGKNCEKDIDLCNKPEVCSNFHSCIDRGSHVACTCKSGFTGANCGVNVNECASQPCKFGGKCQDQENGFICLCLPGYEGEICGQVNETFHDTSRLHLNFMTEDCYSLQRDPAILVEFQNQVAANIRSSCKCPFTENHILNHSVSLKCHDRIAGSLYLRITSVEQYQTEELICLHQLYLTNKKNVASLGNKTREVDVVYNKDRCTQINSMINRNSDSENENGGTIALTIGLVVSLLGLFTAAVVVFLKWRKKSAPAKKQKNDDKKLVDTINLDLLSAVAPTPKSLYRTSGGAHRNYGYTSHNLDPVDVKSKRV